MNVQCLIDVVKVNGAVLVYKDIVITRRMHKHCGASMSEAAWWASPPTGNEVHTVWSQSSATKF